MVRTGRKGMPSRRDLRLALVDQLVQEKKFDEAAAQYEALAKNDPSNPDTLREWGKLILLDAKKPEADRKEAAGDVWRKLSKAKPNDPVVAAQTADLFRSAEMTDDAIAFYKKAIELAPDAAQYREYLGEYFHSLKRPDEAIAVWNAIAEGPNRNSKNLGRLGEVLAGFGFLKQAETSFADACKLDPKDFELRLKHADVLYQLEKHDDADAELAEAGKLALDDDQAEAVFTQQVRNDQASNRVAERITRLNTTLKGQKGPAASATLVKLARYLEAERNLAEATAAAQKAVEFDPRSTKALATAAQCSNRPATSPAPSKSTADWPTSTADPGANTSPTSPSSMQNWACAKKP